MYIQKAEITNIKSIEHFEIEFPNPAGWHVLIGDNGSGKSTIVRAIALALVGKEQSQGLRQNWDDWLRKTQLNGQLDRADGGFIKLVLQIDDDKINNLAPPLPGNVIYKFLSFIKSNLGISIEGKTFSDDIEIGSSKIKKDITENIDNGKEIFGFFSVAFGPYRRFDSGSEEWKKVFENPSLANLASHLSVFGEDVAFTEVIDWLKYLNYQALEQKKGSRHTLENIKKLINHQNEKQSFLPHKVQLESVSSEGVFFKDSNGLNILVNQMSDGYRSALSLIFELIRQLVRVYGAKLVFKNIEKGEMFIDLPGVVLVDEIDAHLHPTWQTRIGQWFLKYFPNLQFIVTTHSPLVCRACEKGSIWRLAAPGSDEKSGEITGLDRERLIYGNVLDAYGTGAFGENTSISEDSNEMLNRLSELNVKSMMGLINDAENKELEELRAKFPTESTVKK